MAARLKVADHVNLIEKRLKVTHELSTRMVGECDIDVFLKDAADITRREFGLASVVILTVDKSSLNLTYRAHSGTRRYIDGLRRLFGESPLDMVFHLPYESTLRDLIEERSSMVIHGRDQISDFTSTKDLQEGVGKIIVEVGIKTSIRVPVVWNNQVVGILLACSRSDDINRQVIDSLEAIAVSLGIAMQKARVERELKTTTDRYQSLFKNSPIAMGIMKPISLSGDAKVRFRLYQSNKEFNHLFGKGVDTLIDGTGTENSIFTHEIRRVLKDVYADGNPRRLSTPVDINGIKCGVVVYMVGEDYVAVSFQDVTPTVRRFELTAKRDRLKYLEIYESALKMASVPIFVWTKKRGIVFSNAKASSLTGYDEPKLASMWTENLVAGEHRESYRTNVETLATLEVGNYAVMEADIVHAKGHRITVNINESLTSMGDDDPVYTMIMTDPNYIRSKIEENSRLLIELRKQIGSMPRRINA